ncbi:pro-neuregulin-3, membrane-bound isoform isoform X3 [Cynoglossus semilaevis]|uniref:Neuregulin 3b n=1 Tax=Cynoglossus semilaevis TaxID=244447 RepID=A0A3P8V847_CYNSE|nr:pro-neuregulin-3, membrane-bound isoform-like isoform X3 [Cynoglossus semilaevis]
MMSERTSTLASMTLEEPGAEQASPRAPGPLRCGPCALWPRQQTWLCAVPLVMGFVGLGLSLMLLKWIVVGSVQDYVPTDLVDPKVSIGQDPIFLSKPSAMPKGPDISTATTISAASTTTMVSTTTLLAADGTASAPRTRVGPPANHSANGSNAIGDGNRAPHLHNRVGTHISGTVVTTATTRPTRLTPPPSGKEATPRSTVRKGSASDNGHSGAANSKPGQTTAASASTTTTVKTSTKMQPTTSQPAPPVKPTSRWGHGRPGKGPATRPHHRFRNPVAPTPPSPRSEVFKPCVEDKDLAFCLNEGECSIIETVAGVHRHCRCKEGYHGLRCDQFVPKSDAISSDPKSGDTYQRQVLSIFSIASGICLLGVACMALYRRNKRHREKLQAHFSDSRGLRDCSVSASGLMSKSSSRLQYSLQLQKSCTSHGSSAKGGSVAPGTPAESPPILGRALSKGKRFRSSSLSLSPAQQQREAVYFRTPPITRGKHKTSALIDGCKLSGHVYKHLQEDESVDVESQRRFDSASGKVGALLSRTSVSHFGSRKGWSEVPCTRLDKETDILPTSSRTHSVPIIPSLQASDLSVGNVEVSEQKHRGLLKWHLVQAGKQAVHVTNSLAQSRRDTAAPKPSVMPGDVSPPAPSAGTTAPPASQENPNSAQRLCSAEITVETPRELKHKSFPSSMEKSGSHSEIHRGATNTPGNGTAHGSDGRSVHTSFGSRVLKAVGQRETQGRCQGQASLEYGGANLSSATRGASCRGSGNGVAKPPAS